MSGPSMVERISALLSNEAIIREAAVALYAIIDGGDSGDWESLLSADQELYCRGVEEVRNVLIDHIHDSGLGGPPRPTVQAL